jgi:protein TonB
MRVWGEFTGFTLAALAAHLLLFVQFPDTGSGQQAGGIGGDAVVTLHGAPGNIAEVIEDWTRPPEVQDQPVIEMALHVAEAPSAQFKVAALTTAPPKMDPPSQLPKSLQEVKPQVDASKAPPPPKPEVKPEPNPKPKPKPKAKPKPKPKEKAKSSNRNNAAKAGSANQKAAGSGGSSQAGNSGNAKVKTLGKGKEAKLVNVWGAKIRTRIERRKKPIRGGSKHGTALIRLKVAPTGQLLSVGIAKSSGVEAIDTAAIAAVKRAGRFAKAPKQLNKSSYHFRISVRF